MRNTKRLVITSTVALLMGAPLAATAVGNDTKLDDPWYADGQASLLEEQNRGDNPSRAKNVILFVGDGMGVSTVTAARILEGQRRGETGEENSLSFEKFPYLALSKTYNTDAQTPDSAGTMTAMVTGVKTKQGVISVADSVVRGDYTTVNPVKTIIEEAERRGLATGIVTTARLTHATPAACYAHSADRNWEDDGDLPAEAAAADFPDIARQLIEFRYGDGIDVAMGGGRRHFVPSEDGGSRSDGRNLTQEWLAQYPGAAYVTNGVEFDAIDTNSTHHLLGLFENSHMEYEADRADDEAEEEGGEPSIAEMTKKAIDILDNNHNGYFLHVEAGRIDHAHHAGNASRSLQDTIAFAEAVQAAVDMTDPEETLIVVTADHSHVFTIGGYPIRGNDILGKVVGVDGEIALAADGMPYTTLTYANGPGYLPERPDLSDVDTSDLEYLQEAAVPLGSETHSAEEVAIYALGPNAQLFRGTKEQNYIYHVMANALGLDAPPGRRGPWWRWW